MAQDLLTTYKLGWKTSYYQNTHDQKTDEMEPAHPMGWKDDVPEDKVSALMAELEDANEAECDACAI
jgi:ribonucleoside-diphosphate reductase alpha chain